MNEQKSSSTVDKQQILEEIDSFLEERAGKDRRTRRKAPDYLNPTLERRKQDRRNKTV